jgi:hypothetical protein
MAIIELRKPFVFDLGWQTIALLIAVTWYFATREKNVYLLDFTTYEPPDNWRISHEQRMEILKAHNCYTQESLDFMERMLKQSGCGPKTAWPPGVLRCLEGLPPDGSIEGSRKESEVSCLSAICGKMLPISYDDIAFRS